MHVSKINKQNHQKDFFKKGKCVCVCEREEETETETGRQRTLNKT